MDSQISENLDNIEVLVELCVPSWESSARLLERDRVALDDGQFESVLEELILERASLDVMFRQVTREQAP